MEKEYEEEWITQEIRKTTKKVLNPFSVGGGAGSSYRPKDVLWHVDGLCYAIR